MKSCMCKISCNWLRVITLYRCRNMLVTCYNIYYACIIEFESLGLPLARRNRIVCWRCYICCVMSWTASMNLMECVASFGMDGRHLELQLVCELHLALGWYMNFVILMLQKCEKCLDSFYMMYMMCLHHWFWLNPSLFQNSIVTCFLSKF